ncbi:MAG TPA: DUF6134 family protein [Steroidobacteraceae bacterium]|nr:DUF6134 family protein [Steroidobacteraceae bacterium]
MSAIIAICAFGFANTSAIASQQRCNYQIHDSLYGRIGIYSNTIEKSGNSTIVTTEAHIRVSLLGVTLYNQDVSRTERWVAGRLMSFHGVTTENGKPVEVNGWAEADHFIVSSPNGKITAPATIRSANPWFAASSGGDTILMPDTGLVTKMHASGGEEMEIVIDGASRQVREYHIETAGPREQYDVWMDEDGTPLMFNLKDSDGTDTFTLVK